MCGKGHDLDPDMAKRVDRRSKRMPLYQSQLNKLILELRRLFPNALENVNKPASGPDPDMDPNHF